MENQDKRNLAIIFYLPTGKEIYTSVWYNNPHYTKESIESGILSGIRLKIGASFDFTDYYCPIFTNGVSKIHIPYEILKQTVTTYRIYD